MDNVIKRVTVTYRKGDEEIGDVSLSGEQATYESALLGEVPFVKIWANSKDSRRTVLIPVHAVVMVALEQES